MLILFLAVAVALAIVAWPQDDERDDISPACSAIGWVAVIVVFAAGLTLASLITAAMAVTP